MSSFKNKNILKADRVVFKGVKPLKTNNTEKISVERETEAYEEIKLELESYKEELNLQIEEAKKTYEEVIAKTELDSKKIIEVANEEAEQIKRQSYEEGHAQGIQNGYEDGYKEAYEENIEKAKLESENIKKEASEILIESKNQVVEYLKNNKKQIIELSITIAEKVLKEKFNEVDSMNQILESVISEYEIKENFVIKANSIYIESINEKINNLKNNQSIKGEVFVLPDDSIEIGNAIIENNKGRLIVGIDSVLDKVKEELL
jgi:flagellar assembly protein FliH